jgi:putative intracellular protease/amidase
MAAKKVVVLASNYGLWAEELQAPWDALKKAGHDVTLDTRWGKKPLPLVLSMDRNFVDPVQNVAINPKEVVDRCEELLSNGEWDNPMKYSDIKMSGYDAIALVGGPGSALDMVGNPIIHDLLVEAFQSNKIIGALCYTVGCLAFARNPANGYKSIIYGKTVVAHPAAWDFKDNMNYPLVGATPDNPGTDIVTQGFAFPLQHMTEDAAGPQGRVISDAGANRNKPCTAYDFPFVTGLSVESSIAYGNLLVDALAGRAGKTAA